MESESRSESGRFKDRNWPLAGVDGNIATWQHVEIAVLMDIRDELKKLNGLLHCGNFIDIPNILRKVETNTRKRNPGKAIKK